MNDYDLAVRGMRRLDASWRVFFLVRLIFGLATVAASCVLSVHVTP